MKKTGLTRSLKFLDERGLELGILITDRHRQLGKFLRDEYPEIDHLFDIWHIGKGLRKKLEAASKTPDCSDIKPWIPSIINHLYWSAVSTPPNQGDMILSKWISVVEHVQNSHSNFGGLFPQCAHGRLEGREIKKKWIKPCSKAITQLEAIVCSTSLKRDVRQMSGRFQTSYIEAFHSLLNHFAPKMLAFSYIGMKSRTLLAGMHFTENMGRHHLINKKGEKVYTIQYPKLKKGGNVVRCILEDPTFEYVSELMEMVAEMCKAGDTNHSVPDVIPPPLNAAFEKTPKAEAVAGKISRYA
ncbi:hypothetical protein ScPMuIL_000552 [Solemya velum]